VRSWDRIQITTFGHVISTLSVELRLFDERLKVIKKGYEKNDNENIQFDDIKSI